VPQYLSVVLDVDSTLCDVEGVDWLARLRGEELARQSANLTDRAMNGELPIEAVYAERMDLIRPTREEVDALARVYVEKLAPGAATTIRALRHAGVRVVLVSGGLRRAILAVARSVGVAEADINAVDVQWDEAGTYQDFDRQSPLTTQTGKVEVVRKLALPRPILAVGDGATDAAMRPVVDSFVAFTAFQRRDRVVAASDREVRNFAELESIVVDSENSDE
jgi:phosphoserine phosphatase